MEPEQNHYSFKELTDMILIYGECRKNHRQAAALYAQKFPDRHPDHGFFYRLHQRLETNGQFYKSSRFTFHQEIKKQLMLFNRLLRQILI